MTSNNGFFYSLLRISMLQLLKAQGFDRAKPSTVDTITDLYVKFLDLLTKEIMKLAQARCDQDDIIALQDITQAFQNLGIVKPNDILDVYDENPELPGDQGLQNFKDWCLNNSLAKDARKVALPTIDLLKLENAIGSGNTANGNNASSKTGKSSTAIPEYISQLQPGQQEELIKENEKENELIEDLINNGEADDWIRMVITRQKLGLLSRMQNREIPENGKGLPVIAGFKHSILGDILHTNDSSMNLNYNTDPIQDNSKWVSLNEFVPSSLENSNNNSSSKNISNNNNNNNNDNNSHMPTGANLAQEEPSELVNRASELLKKLPAMRHDTKIENITLSFENGEYDYIEENQQQEKPDSNDNENTVMKNDYPSDNEPMETQGPLQFTEMEDMDNTFQRRASLDYSHPF